MTTKKKAKTPAVTEVQVTATERDRILARYTLGAHGARPELIEAAVMYARSLPADIDLKVTVNDLATLMDTVAYQMAEYQKLEEKFNEMSGLINLLTREPPEAYESKMTGYHVVEVSADPMVRMTARMQLLRKLRDLANPSIWPDTESE